MKGIFSLRHRRLRGGMIEMFKMIQGIEKVNLWKFFLCADEERRARIHSLCSKARRHVNSNIGLNCFIRRVINNWNNITDIVISCKFSSTFKIKWDEFMIAKE